MIRHHPSETTLIARAAGSLPVLHARVLDVHLGVCPLCQNRMRELEEIGGVLLTTLPPARLEPDGLNRILARLSDVVPAALPDKPDAPLLSTLATGSWRWLGPGIRLMPLVPRDQTGTRLDLIRVAPNVALPRHGHDGLETVCILQGGYSDEAGHYAPHDILEGGRTLQHSPVAIQGPDCICLIATTGRLRASMWLARIILLLVDL